MTPPQKNKVPTDEDILVELKCEAHETRRSYSGKQAIWSGKWVVPEIDLRGAIRKARAAGRAEGREEQREKDLGELNKELNRNLKEFFPDHYVDLCFQDGWKTALDYAEQAIRAQGEEKQNG